MSQRRQKRGRKPTTQRAELAIESYAQGGDGVGFVEVRGERRAVFVTGTVRGDRVEADVDFSQRPARAIAFEISEASADRRDAPCEDAERCGGCNWMWIDDRARAHALVSLVRDALGDALTPDTQTEHHVPTIGAQRRSRARLHVRAQSSIAVGFHASRSTEIVTPKRCHVLDDRLESVRERLPELFTGSRGRGDIHMALGAITSDPSSADRPVVLSIDFTGSLAPHAMAEAERWVESNTVGGLEFRLDGAARPLTIGDPTPYSIGADGEPLELAAGGFAQASEGGNRLLTERVIALARAQVPRDSQVVELFSGAGNIGVALAREARSYVAVERDASASIAASRNFERRAIDARCVCADANIFSIPRRTDLVVLDPPRAGAAKAMNEVISARAQHVIYVSCDPTTLARDVRALQAAGYALGKLETFDLFSRTSHIECVAVLSRSRS